MLSYLYNAKVILSAFNKKIFNSQKLYINYSFSSRQDVVKRLKKRLYICAYILLFILYILSTEMFLKESFMVKYEIITK